MIKAVFFDFDGVIVDSNGIKTFAFLKLFENENKEIVTKIINYHLKNLGISRYEKFSYIYKMILCRNLTNRKFRLLCQEFSSLVKNAVVRAEYIKGAREFLSRYANKYKCFLISATPQEEIEEIIRARKLRPFFKFIYGAPTKKIEAVKRILAKEKIKPSNCVYIGDSLSDYKAAQNNSISFIAKISSNASLFKDMDCPKIKDLTVLNEIIEKL